MIISLQTTTFGAFGGIPTYNRLICHALNDTAPSNVLVATDTNADINGANAELPNLEIEAFGRNRVALLLRVLSLALTRKFGIALMGHVNYAPLGWLLKRIQPRLRYGVVLYGIEAWTKLPRMRRRALQEADFVISISDYTKQRAIASNGLKPERVHLLPNAIESSARESTRATNVRASKGVCLLSVCRLDDTEKYKGVDLVLEVLKEVAKQVPDVHYVVVGTGNDLERHKRLADSVGVGDRVQFLGSVDKKTLEKCYLECDVFVMPSAGEGFGFVFLEAMQHAKPVVAALSGGTPEVVENGVTGILVEYGDRRELAAVLLDLCLDSNRREVLGQAGYDRLQEKFTFSQFRRGLKDILAAYSGVPDQEAVRNAG